MEQLDQAILETISGITVLTDEESGLLAENLNWNGKGTLSRENSVVRELNLSTEFMAPFVSFSAGSVPSIGKSRLAQVFVRVYDEVKLSSGSNLVRIKEIIRDTLNDELVSITKDDKVYLYHFESTLEQPARVDEALNLSFVELEFNCTIP
jgi:hypothetical protein